VLVGLQQPWSSRERVKLLIEKQITCFAFELLPRISRAQSMDVLSSQAAVAGYECALIAADHSPKFFPMLTYAAGTIRPAKVLVIGAGVAGLQAIATAKRLGAMVSGYDVRPETKEQIESLGAKFVDTGVSAAGGRLRPRADRRGEAPAGRQARQGHRRVRRADHHRGDPRQEGAGDRHRRDGGAHEAGLGGRRHGGRDRRQRGRHPGR
jgi:NAD(P) transhydrogenase subunit alpha